jgi:hypothetical protein
MLEAETDHAVETQDGVTPQTEGTSPQTEAEGVEKPEAEKAPNYEELYKAEQAKTEKLSKGIEKMEGRIGKITKRSKESEAQFQDRINQAEQELQQKRSELEQYTGISEQAPQQMQQPTQADLMRQAEFNVEAKRIGEDPKMIELSSTLEKKGISPFTPIVNQALMNMGGLKKKVEAILSNEDVAFDLSQARSPEQVSYLIGEAVAQLKTNASSEAKTKSKVINEPKKVPKQTTGNEASNPTEAPKDAESFHLWNIQNNLKNKRS